jgi:hypothetical protein
MAGIRPAPEEWRRFERAHPPLSGRRPARNRRRRLRLTNRGVLLSNEVFQEFLTP